LIVPFVWLLGIFFLLLLDQIIEKEKKNKKNNLIYISYLCIMAGKTDNKTNRKAAILVI